MFLMRKDLFKIVHYVLLAVITFTFTVPPQYAQAQMVVTPSVSVAIGYAPAIIKGVNLDPQNPLKFDFILDRGDDRLQGDAFTQESQKLVRYFLSSLTISQKDMWVNLSPNEPDRIVPKTFGNTEMGRDILAQDFLLKQLTASLMSPDGKSGRAFWDKVYAGAQAKFGTTEVPYDVFNKIWIVPSKAQIYEHGKGAFVTGTQFKVMTEKDYLDTGKGNGIDKPATVAADEVDTSDITLPLIKEVIIPAIEQEVNHGKTFANLRQIYNSLILAMWYKEKVKQSVLGQAYSNKEKTAGLEVASTEKQKIYNQYLEAFKKGATNAIKEEYDPATQETIPRKYFLGGLKLDPELTFGDKAQMNDAAAATESPVVLTLRIDPAQSSDAAEGTGEQQIQSMGLEARVKARIQGGNFMQFRPSTFSLGRGTVTIKFQYVKKSDIEKISDELKKIFKVYVVDQKSLHLIEGDQYSVDLEVSYENIIYGSNAAMSAETIKKAWDRLARFLPKHGYVSEVNDGNPELIMSSQDRDSDNYDQQTYTLYPDGSIGIEAYSFSTEAQGVYTASSEEVLNLTPNGLSYRFSRHGKLERESLLLGPNEVPLGLVLRRYLSGIAPEVIVSQDVIDRYHGELPSELISEATAKERLKSKDYFLVNLTGLDAAMRADILNIALEKEADRSNAAKEKSKIEATKHQQELEKTAQDFAKGISRNYLHGWEVPWQFEGKLIAEVYYRWIGFSGRNEKEQDIIIRYDSPDGNYIRYSYSAGDKIKIGEWKPHLIPILFADQSGVDAVLLDKLGLVLQTDSFSMTIPFLMKLITAKEKVSTQKNLNKLPRC